MSKKNKREKLLPILGRDPACGIVAFKTGTIPSPKNKASNRNSKRGQQEHRRAINGE